LFGLGGQTWINYSRGVKLKRKPSRPKSSAWLAAEALGFDMSLVRSNLRLTPLERIRRHDRALATATALRRAMKERHASA
jgi:hypothetical protein